MRTLLPANIQKNKACKDEAENAEKTSLLNRCIVTSLIRLCHTAASKMAALNRATKANYVIHDHIEAETSGEFT